MKIDFKQSNIENIETEDLLKYLEEVFPEYSFKASKNTILVRKTTFVGAYIRINNKRKFISIFGIIPSIWARIFCSGLLAVLILRKRWKVLEEEIALVLEKKIKN